MAFIEPIHRNKPNITYLLIINMNRSGLVILFQININL